MSCTCMQSFSFIPLTASEEKIFYFLYFFFSKIYPLCCHGKFSDLDKIHTNRKGLLKKNFCKKSKFEGISSGVLTHNCVSWVGSYTQSFKNFKHPWVTLCNTTGYTQHSYFAVQLVIPNICTMFHNYRSRSS